MPNGCRAPILALVVACLIAAQSSSVSARATAQATAASVCESALSPSALTANRNGRLTDEQARLWDQIAQNRRKQFHLAAVWDAVIGGLLVSAHGPSSKAAARIALGLGALAAAPAIYLWPNRSALAADVRSGTVLSIDGAVAKRRVSGHTISFYYLDVAGRRFEISRHGYDAAPDAGLLRVYFLPRSRRVVNWERLPDPAVPAGPGAAWQVLDQLAAARRRHDPTAVAEARARLAALMNAIAGEPSCARQ